MATFNQLLDGLCILKKYVKVNGSLSADHDILYVGSDEKVSEYDEKRLDELGWHYDEKFDSWARFV
jgi:hypothetical protein